MNNSAAHIERTLDVIRKLFLASSIDIDAIKEGEKITATGLAEKIGATFCKKCLQNKTSCACKAVTCKKCLKKGVKDPKCSCESLGFEPLEGPQYYVVLKFLLNDYPGIEVTRGAQGGIRRKKTSSTVIAPVVITASTANVMVSNSESSDDNDVIDGDDTGDVIDDTAPFEKEPLSIRNT